MFSRIRRSLKRTPSIVPTNRENDIIDNYVFPEDLTVADTEIQNRYVHPAHNIVNTNIDTTQLLDVEPSRTFVNDEYQPLEESIAYKTKTKPYKPKNISLINKIMDRSLINIAENVINKVNIINEKNSKKVYSNVPTKEELFALYTIHGKYKLSTLYDEILDRKDKLSKLEKDYIYVYMFYISPFSDDISKRMNISLHHNNIRITRFIRYIDVLDSINHPRTGLLWQNYFDFDINDFTERLNMDVLNVQCRNAMISMTNEFEDIFHNLNDVQLEERIQKGGIINNKTNKRKLSKRKTTRKK